MADLLKNNPMALHHCILFEVLQGTSIKEAYSEFCKTIGNDFMEYREFDYRYHQLLKGEYDSEKISDFLKNSPMALRHCILFEVLQGTSIEEAYPKFCKTIGEDFMEYREFDFRYYRFLNGKYDLNFERDDDKKIYELSDMPIVVMEDIVRKLDIIDRSSLSRTSRSFHAFVEDQKIFHNTLKLEVSYPTATISFNESANIQYIKEYAACRKVSKNREEIFRAVPYWKQAIRDFKKTLQNPKLHLDTLEIEVSAAIEVSFNKRNVFNNLEDAFKLTHHLNVKNLILNEYSSSLLTSILPTLNPGYLTSIDIDFRNANVNSVGNVLETKQWKQVKYFKMNGALFIWPLHHLYHLKEFTVFLERLSVEDFRQIKKVLFKSPDFKKCSLTVSREIDESIIAQEFGNALRKSQYVYHYPIPTSTEYFEIRVEGHRFKVARKKN